MMEDRTAKDEALSHVAQASDDIHLGASIIGFYGGISLAYKCGYDPKDIFDLVRGACFDRPIHVSLEEYLETR